MELVLDANILMSALVTTNGFTYDLIFNDKIKLFSPEFISEEFEEHREEIIKKSNLANEEIELFLNLISTRIHFISKEELIPYFQEAEKISPDKDDSVYFALALKLNCPIWSNDKKLKMQDKIKVYSTRELIDSNLLG